MLDFLQYIDENIFFAINGLHNPFFDKIMWQISAKFTWVPLYAAILGWLIYKYRTKSLIYIIFLVLLIIASDQGSVHLFKNVFERYRPSHNPDFHNLVHIVNGYRGGKYGFISSHASNTFAFVSFLIPVFNKKCFTIFMVFWIILVSYSRIYLGVHYPFDILAGGAFGWMLGYGFYQANQFFIFKVIEPKKEFAKVQKNDF